MNESISDHGDDIFFQDEHWENTSKFFDNSTTDAIRIVDDLTQYLGVRIMLVVMFSAVVFIGSIGNSVVLVTGCRNRRPNSVYSVFIVNLALCDLYRLLCDGPVIKLLIINLVVDGNTGERAETLCSISTYVTITCGACSIWTMFVISVERYTAVCRPFKYSRLWTKNRARSVVLFNWILCIVSLSPIVFTMVNTVNVITVAYDTSSAQDGDMRQICVFVMTTDTLASNIYYTYLFLFAFGFPLVAISVAYIRVFRELYRGVDNLSHTSAARRETDRRRKIAKMMVYILLVFVVCWLPYMCLCVYAAFGGNMEVDNIIFIYVLFSWFVCLCSAINPYIYSRYSRDFRNNLRKVMCCCRTERQVNACCARTCCCYHGKELEVQMGASTTNESSVRTYTSVLPDMTSSTLGNDGNAATEPNDKLPSEENSSVFTPMIAPSNNLDQGDTDIAEAGKSI